MSYKKISDITGFSVSTISKAFSQSKEISDRTKKKIYEAAAELGCFDKYYKDKYPKRIAAVICPELKSRYISAITEAVLHMLQQNDFLALISTSDFNPEREREFAEYYALYSKVDAIIFITPTLNEIKRYTIPVVSIGKHVENADEVGIDLWKATYDAVRLFKENGHTRIAFIGERLTAAKERHFISAMKRLKLPVTPQLVIRSRKRFENAGRDSISYLMSLDEPPTAILAAYDNIAIGAIYALKSQGFNVPEDVSVIGMDDIADAQNILPPLTTVKTFITDAAFTAVEMIIKKINNPYFKAIQKTSIRAELVKRESVGPVCRQTIL